MIDWEKFRFSLDSFSRIENKLMTISEDKFYDQPKEIKGRIFNPLNIFYIQTIAGEKRGTYKAFLDAPVEIESYRKIIRVEFYIIKAGSLKEILEILGDDFMIIGQDLICPLNRIRNIGKTLETITLRRMVLPENLREEYGLKREEKLSGGRSYIRSVNSTYYETYWVKFSKNSLVDDSQKDLWGNEFGSSICFNPMNIAYIESKKGIKSVQLRSINAGRSICPLYEFYNRKGLNELLGNNLFKLDGSGGLFIQINKSCFVSIYCLISLETRLVQEKLSIGICVRKSVTFEVGEKYISPLSEILR